ncbi:putative amino-acid ABC transporter permease protein y4tG [Paraburkholderia piptadeniae]|uniref:Ectoine/hydroxyectoine ABC transporter permease subunit EhuD n=2 Tax=Paraburkholderia TaxID=1822464 RepID=A0A7X1TI76_9BURK|nr:MULTISPECIES: ectoine/hydroxyectoine ABC transporter permease subunit EhuD [Paraburkholderia]MPW20397.1 ectoine/hydroxyectoine ABC transporter permease subunit EhuD [Paraburkholderia franconis]SIT50973.1 putative amino-acid ABC transporter permease protein y4tG [Paraburkholderia piptadeniae]
MAPLFDVSYAVKIAPELLRACTYTVGITICAFAIALVLGLVLAVLRRSKSRPVAKSSAFVIEFVRSTPLLIQVYVLFYVAPIYGLTMTALTAGTLGLAIHYSCYLSEVYRAGLNGVHRGQWEAATALSLSPGRTYSDVILPQAIRTITPVLGNYLNSMFKETPVLSAITVVEVMQQAKNIGAESYRYLEPITMAGLFFLMVSLCCAYGIRHLERQLKLP